MVQFPLPFSNYQQNAGGMITLPDGRRAEHYTTTRGENNNEVYHRYDIGNQQIIVENSPSGHNVEVRTRDSTGHTTSYNYTNRNGTAEYSVTTSGPPPRTPSRVINQSEFVSGVNSAVGAFAQDWTTQLNQAINASTTPHRPPTTPQRPNNNPSSPSNSGAGVLQIVTDGTNTIVGDYNDPSHSNVYSNRQPAPDVPRNGRHRVDNAVAVGGVEGASILRHDNALVNTLPPNVLNEIARIASQGGAVLVTHVSDSLRPSQGAHSTPPARQR